MKRFKRAAKTKQYTVDTFSKGKTVPHNKLTSNQKDRRGGDISSKTERDLERMGKEKVTHSAVLWKK